jgi:hypothetical protein
MNTWACEGGAAAAAARRATAAPPPCVVAGLVPAIHVGALIPRLTKGSANSVQNSDRRSPLGVDGRDKPGHDDHPAAQNATFARAA